MIEEKLPRIEQLVHGYSRGHELLSTSVGLEPGDLDEINRLSDLSGSLIGDDPPSYLTAYPLPSGAWYALARTWADNQASRRGCVLTRTALIPMAHWMSIASAEPVLHSLKPVDRKTLQPTSRPLAIDWRVSPEKGALPPSLDLRLPDLVRMIFVEGRDSVVWPLTEESGAGIDLLAARLLSALWPAQRATFNLCTYALHPRQGANRPFNLMFAPMQAISRFRVPGLDILEASPNSKSSTRADHVVRILRQLLNGAKPLEDWSSYAELREVLPAQRDAFLKLASLDELRRSRTNNVSAQLAALDILGSLAPAAELAFDAKHRAAVDALRSALSLPPVPALDGLSGLVQRLQRPALALSSGVEEEARARVAHIASMHVSDAVGWATSDGMLRELVLPDIANGLAKAKGKELAALGLLPSGSVLLESVLTQAPQLAERYVADAKLAEVDARLTTTADWLAHVSEVTREQMLMHLKQSAPVVRSEPILRQVAAILEANDVVHVLAAAHEASSSAAWPAISLLAGRFPAQVRAFYRHARSFAGEEIQLFASVLDEQTVIEALDQALKLGLDPATRLAIAYLRGRSPKPLTFMTTLFGDANRPLLTVLWRGALAEIDGASEALFTLLEDVSASDLLNVVSPAQLLQPGVSTGVDRVVQKVLPALLKQFLEGRVDTDSFWRWWFVVDQVRGGTWLDRVVDAVSLDLWRKADPARVWALLEKRIDSLPTLDANTFADRITKTLSVTQDRQSAESAAIWARVASKAVQLSKEHRELVAVRSFEAAMRLQQRPVSAVLVVTFPVLHAGLPGKRKAMMFLGLLPLPYEIDRRKDARRALVDAFLHSLWPPGDLALAAHRAGVLSKIAARLRALGRLDYLARVSKDLRGRNDPLSSAIADQLERTAGGEE